MVTPLSTAKPAPLRLPEGVRLRTRRGDPRDLRRHRPAPGAGGPPYTSGQAIVTTYGLDDAQRDELLGRWTAWWSRHY